MMKEKMDLYRSPDLPKKEIIREILLGYSSFSLLKLYGFLLSLVFAFGIPLPRSFTLHLEQLCFTSHVLYAQTPSTASSSSLSNQTFLKTAPESWPLLTLYPFTFSSSDLPQEMDSNSSPDTQSDSQNSPQSSTLLRAHLSETVLTSSSLLPLIILEQGQQVTLSLCLSTSSLQTLLPLNQSPADRATPLSQLLVSSNLQVTPSHSQDPASYRLLSEISSTSSSFTPRCPENQSLLFLDLIPQNMGVSSYHLHLPLSPSESSPSDPSTSHPSPSPPFTREGLQGWLLVHPPQTPPTHLLSTFLSTETQHTNTRRMQAWQWESQVWFLPLFPFHSRSDLDPSSGSRPSNSSSPYFFSLHPHTPSTLSSLSPPHSLTLNHLTAFINLSSHPLAIDLPSSFQCQGGDPLPEYLPLNSIRIPQGELAGSAYRWAGIQGGWCWAQRVQDPLMMTALGYSQQGGRSWVPSSLLFEVSSTSPLESSALNLLSSTSETSSNSSLSNLKPFEQIASTYVFTYLGSSRIQKWKIATSLPQDSTLSSSPLHLQIRNLSTQDQNFGIQGHPHWRVDALGNLSGPYLKTLITPRQRIHIYLPSLRSGTWILGDLSDSFGSGRHLQVHVE